MERYLKEISKSIVLTYYHIYRYIHTCNIYTYIMCHKKLKYDL